MSDVEETATEEEREEIRRILLDQREQGDPNSTVTATNPQGVMFFYALGENDQLILVGTSEDKDPLYG